MIGFFITGTGTGVGKTHVTTALARRGRDLGKRVFAFKPIETGCELVGGVLLGADQTLLCEAAGNWQVGQLRGCYQFVDPVAPAVAARKLGVSIDLLEIVRVLELGAAQVDLTLVEGAGGWRVPITDSSDMATLAVVCKLPILVVGTATLGTINHTLLTVEAVERDGCKVAGVVLSRHPGDALTSTRTNVEEIRSRWSGLVLVYEHDTSLDPLFHVERPQ